MSTMELWDRVFKTDPKHVKPITGKDYSGNSPKPYYIVERLTQEFGPCGIGWGYTIESERFERFSDTDVLHIARVRMWFMLGGKRGEVEQMGQTKATYVTGQGKFKVDEDAPKKSVTDALVKCASYLGFAGDIFSGRWDDSKYVAELKKEFSETISAPKEAAKAATHTDDRIVEMQTAAADMVELFVNGEESAVLSIWRAKEWDNEERIWIWNWLQSESKLRAFLKANKESK